MKMKNEDELAGVLSHELGHINARHTANQYSKSMILQGGLMIAGLYLQQKKVKYSEIYMTAGMIGSSMLLMKYSRDDERQADALGMEYMTRAGYNPRGLVDLMNILKSLSDREPSKLEVLFATHPLSSERLVNMTNLSNQSYSQYSGIQYKTLEFSKALGVLKNNSTAYDDYDKSLTLAADKKYNEAEALLNSAIKKYNADPIFYAQLADVKIDQKNFKDARNFAEQALRMNPNLFISRLTAGVAQTELGDYKSSIQNLTAADKIISDNFIVAFYLAKSFDYNGNIANAVSYYKKVLETTDQKDYVEYAQRRLKILAPEEYNQTEKNQSQQQQQDKPKSLKKIFK